METIRVLLIGDVVGDTGRAVVARHLPNIIQQHTIDMTILNGENSSNQGRGITPKIAQEFYDNGVDVITTGNHIWFRREIYPYFDEQPYILRPANFPSGAPGSGVTTITIKGKTVGVINLQGRVFMKEHLECPFKSADSLLAYLKDKTNIILIDFHAEATSEKEALAYYVAGRVSGVVGTHTHVQTADERVLPGGTAYLTDLGMVGSLNSMLGMQKEPIIQNFLTQLPVRFAVDDKPPYVLSGAIIEVDAQTGSAIKIDRLRLIDENPL
jgi:2',3'-cyclic-nucleotide 2'-phosphodiesterase